MFLNSIQPAKGATHARRHVGRDIGNDLDKTGGHGHKGQKSHSGGFHKVGFEGGQMSLQHRLPKRGFKSLTAATNVEIRLNELNLLAVDEIDVLVLKQVGLVPATVSSVKVITFNELPKAIVLKSIRATKGAKVAIETADDRVGE